MPGIFIVTVDSDPDRSDLDSSIATAVERKSVIQSFSDATYPELVDMERRARGFFAWGVDADEDNVAAWFQMGFGDFVLFAVGGTYCYYAKVLGRYENIRAAQALWPVTAADMGREFLFFVTEPIAVSLPVDELADYLEAQTSGLVRVPAETHDRIEADFGTVERFIRRRLLSSSAGGPLLDVSGMIQVSERDMARMRQFDPASSKQGRADTIQAILKRRGHPQFRSLLMAAYERKCAITDSNAIDTLEAAYIVPFKGQQTHHPSNGLLLRSDIHVLFDLGKLAIDTRSMSVLLSGELDETHYRILAGRPVFRPKDKPQRPDLDSLDQHRKLAGL